MTCSRTLLTSVSSILLALPVVSCAQDVDPPAYEVALTQTWRCRNDIEISCTGEGCVTEATDSFTPMDIYVETTGNMSICAYTGCWEGDGQALTKEPFLIFFGEDLDFSTAPDPQDIVLTIDRRDRVGLLKVATYALPVLCEAERATP